jgi:HSP20 family molecular chaperone IbpA
METDRRYDMNLIRYNPNTLSLMDNMSTWFDDFFTEPGLGRSTVPAVDIRETDSDYLMEVELPGLTEKDVEVKLDNALLTISSKKDEKKEEKKNGYVLRERCTSSFNRSFVLPEGVDRENIGAECKNGVLHLTFPKVPAAKPKTIEVKAN